MPPDGAYSIDEAASGNRVSFTALDYAFLESPPAYEEQEWALEDASLPPVVVRVPSPERRAAALRLFVLIGGSAVLVLVLALLLSLWRAVFS